MVLGATDSQHTLPHEYFYLVNKCNINANSEASDNVITVNEPSSEMLTSRSQKLEWAENRYSACL